MQTLIIGSGGFGWLFSGISRLGFSVLSWLHSWKGKEE